METKPDFAISDVHFVYRNVNATSGDRIRLADYLITPKMQGHAVMHDARRFKNKMQQILADRERRIRGKQESVMDTPPSTPPSTPPRIPTRNVRRCLFPESLNEKARQEYRQKVFEEIKKLTEKDKQKYNFDDYDIFRNVNGQWVYMEPKPVIDIDSTKTPHRETDNKSLPEIGKRKRDDGEVDHQAVKRRLSYD